MSFQYPWGEPGDLEISENVKEIFKVDLFLGSNLTLSKNASSKANIYLKATLELSWMKKDSALL